MSEAWVCGTGDWRGPKPGDPDMTNILLWVTPAFGGIDIEWSYPHLNPEAVLHTILYRSTSPDKATAVRHKVVAGNFFYDKSTTATAVEYYYWIQLVSVNGTYGDLIGPRAARARPPIQAILEDLAQKIDAGMLSQSLKQDIDQISLNKLGITAEMQARDAADQALGVSFNQVQAHSQNTRALLQEEMLARTSADEAFAASVNTLYAEIGDSIAAIQVEQQVQANDISSLARRVTTVQSSLQDEIASVQVNLQTNIDVVNGTVREIGALYTAKVDVNGLIGGFGVFNDGTTVEAGFDVDRFWVGRTKNKVKPFVIENDEVFMNEAVINKLTFNKLRSDDGTLIVQNGKVRASYLDLDFASVTGAIQSNNYSPGYTGWKLDREGMFENNGVVSGRGRMSQTNRAIKVFDGNNRLRVQLGDLTA